MSGSMIDDSDPAVVYSGRWYTYSDWSSNYQRTVHVSNSVNDRAVLTFQGIGVLVYSGQQGIGSRLRSSYTIDGGSPTTIVYSNETYQSTSQAYRSPTLPDGLHTLTVTNLGSDNNIYSLFLDSFLVFTADETTSTPPSTSSTTTSLTSGSSTSLSPSSGSSSISGIAQSGTSTSTTLSSANFPVTATRSSSSSSSSSMPSLSPPTNPTNPNQIPLIVGPILGAIVICSFIFFLLRRWRKQKEVDSPFTPPSFGSPMRFPPATHLADGQKPSSFLRDLSEPPPYIQDLRPPTPNRLPTKLRTAQMAEPQAFVVVDLG